MKLFGPKVKMRWLVGLLLEYSYDFLNLFGVTKLVIADGQKPFIEIQVAEKGMLVAIGA